MDYVTRDELDKAIARCEKLGTAEKHLSKMDVELRGYFRDLIEALELKSSQSVDNKIAVLSDKTQTAIKSSESTVKNNLIKEVEGALDQNKGHITETILASVYKTLKDFTNDIDQRIKSQNQELKIKVQDDLNANVKTVDDSVQGKIELFKADIENDLHKRVHKAINQASSLFTKSLLEVFDQHQEDFRNELKIFKASIDEELSHKVVDKQAIDGKFTQIENEMKAKVQQIITFQLNQARHMMEQSARAEINESLKSLTGNFLGSL
jgi:hypothetical protein